MLRFLCATILMSVFMYSCSDNSSDQLPQKPVSVEEVKDFLRAKEFITERTGFFSNITINDKTEMEWIDVDKEKEKYAKEAAVEQKKFALKFVSDSVVTLFKRDTSFAATYNIDNEAGDRDEDDEGIKLKISYTDPEFSFGGTDSPITFTYVILGTEGDKLLLQLPQTINRRKLISLLKTE